MEILGSTLLLNQENVWLAIEWFPGKVIIRWSLRDRGIPSDLLVDLTATVGDLLLLLPGEAPALALVGLAEGCSESRVSIRRNQTDWSHRGED